MGRSRINLEPYRQDLTDLFLSGASVEDLRTWLLEEKDVRIGERSIRTQLGQWNVRKKSKIELDVALPRRLRELFHDGIYQDHEMLSILNKEGFDLNLNRLRRERYKLGLYKTFRSQTKDAEQERVDGLVEKKLAESSIDQYGYRMVHTQLRMDGENCAR